VSELTDLADRLGRILDSDAQKRIVTAAGIAAKKVSLDAATTSLGGDRAMRNFKKGRVRLGVGFDVVSDHEVQMNYRPDGAWILADQGRHRTKKVTPKRRQAKAFQVPPAAGFRRSFISGRSRGLNTFQNAARDSGRVAPEAASDAVDTEIRKALR